MNATNKSTPDPIPRLTYTADLSLPLRTLGEIANPANEYSNRIALARISMSCDILANALPFLMLSQAPSR